MGFEDLEKGQTSSVIQNAWQPMDDDGSRNTLKGDWLAEDGATEDVAGLVTRESHVREKASGPNEKWGKDEEGKPKDGSEVRTVPLGEHHICFNLKPFTRSHLT